ncbi:Rgp1-domain-containing protein [Gonapodya prolifera JEL478]|uniref:Rgp1-domain-containing protein n=1 Tax=Gonapodya prolifera (strain JEL478) TaxID=1344416 RepID=A0A139AL35_GONPJ|nr:Rgp1-domain-containing protein [Gonapodya prolifera JEL478]|eukprot:KXS17512.1 Rgp1-domain-containing protein [Gonapodya prolifera JEL478]
MPVWIECETARSNFAGGSLIARISFANSLTPPHGEHDPWTQFSFTRDARAAKAAAAERAGMGDDDDDADGDDFDPDGLAGSASRPGIVRGVLGVPRALGAMTLNAVRNFFYEEAPPEDDGDDAREDDVEDPSQQREDRPPAQGNTGGSLTGVESQTAGQFPIAHDISLQSLPASRQSTSSPPRRPSTSLAEGAVTPALPRTGSSASVYSAGAPSIAGGSWHGTAAAPGQSGSASPRRSFSLRARQPKPEPVPIAFARVVGHLTVDPSYVDYSKLEQGHGKAVLGVVGGGSLGSAGTKKDSSILIFSSHSTVLFADQILQPNEKRTFSYQIHLPVSLPPSYRGRVGKVSYRLVVGVRRGSLSDGAGETFEVPFRLYAAVPGHGGAGQFDVFRPLMLTGADSSVASEDDGASGGKQRGSLWVETRDAAPASPNGEEPLSPGAQDDGEETGTNIYAAWSVLVRRSPEATFRINRGDTPVAQIVLLRPSFRLGEAVTGTVTFVLGTVRCYQIALILELVEVVDPACALRDEQQITKLTSRRVAEHRQFCLNMVRIPVALPIPPHLPTSFTTNAVSLSWRLRAEFVTGGEPGFEAEETIDPHVAVIRAPRKVTTDTWSCELPITVHGLPEEELEPARHIFKN